MERKRDTIEMVKRFFKRFNLVYAENRSRGYFGLIVLVLMLTATAAVSPAANQSDPIQLRFKHAFLLDVQQKGASLKLSCAGLGMYTSPLAANISASDGTTVIRKEVLPGQSAEIALPDQAGIYTLSLDAGYNVYSVRISGASWAIKNAPDRPLQLFGTGNAETFYFFVPETVGKFAINMETNEPASASVVQPDDVSPVDKDNIPLDTKRTYELSAAPNLRNRLWRLVVTPVSEGDLAIRLDERLPQLVFREPLTPAQLKRFMEPTYYFDGRPASLSMLVTEKEKAKVTLETKGLSLGISDTGKVARVSIGTSTFTPQLYGGFLVSDQKAGRMLVRPQGNLENKTGSSRLGLQWKDLQLSGSAEFREEPGCISVSGEISDETGQDRAVTLYFLLPLPAEAIRSWWDNIDEARPVLVNNLLGMDSMGNFMSSPDGVTGPHSRYPLGCVTGDNLGMAMGIPLSQPVIHRIGYLPATGQMFMAFDFALTPDTKKFPRKAKFAFSIYPCDGKLGFRGALARHYEIYPKDFERRIPKIGGWVAWGNMKNVPNPEDTGLLYHWMDVHYLDENFYGGSTPEAVAFDDKIGVYSLLYSDSMRYMADLGTFDHQPVFRATGKDKELARAAFQKLLTATDPRQIILSYPERALERMIYEAHARDFGQKEQEAWLKESLEAARVSAIYASDGDIVPCYLIIVGGGPPNFWNGRLVCNPDPDIPGGYGQFLLKRVFEREFEYCRKTANAELDGISLDNYFHNSYDPNYRREHFAFVDHPLVFSYSGLRPFALGDFLLYEWVEELEKQMHSQGKWVIAGIDSSMQAFPFALSLLDIHGYETRITKDVAQYARALAYHKPIVTLQSDGAINALNLSEPAIRELVLFGIMPGGAAGSFADPQSPTRAIYRKYVPAIKRCAESGWEPVTYARTDNSRVKIERFGREKGKLLFTLYNEATEKVTAIVRISAGDVGLAGSWRKDGLVNEELISGQKIEWRPEGNALVTSLTLEPNQAMVAAF